MLLNAVNNIGKARWHFTLNSKQEQHIITELSFITFVDIVDAH